MTVFTIRYRIHEPDYQYSLWRNISQLGLYMDIRGRYNTGVVVDKARLYPTPTKKCLQVIILINVCGLVVPTIQTIFALTARVRSDPVVRSAAGVRSDPRVRLDPGVRTMDLGTTLPPDFLAAWL